MMNRTILGLALGAAILAASGAARAADTVGTTIYSPTPQMFQPFEMQMRLAPETMKVIHADIEKMHRISCTLSGGTEGNDMAVLHCTPG